MEAKNSTQGLAGREPVGGASISVVIPLYNKASHIARALDSVLAQSEQPVEVIVVDDGSTDGSGDIAVRYTNRGVRLIRQENQGVSVARNRGISEARGDLIAFLDADDEWLPEHLATIARLAAKYPGCGAYAQTFEVVATDGRRWVHVSPGIPAFPWEGIIPNYFRSATTNPVWSSAVAVPKHVFDEVGLFPAGVAVGEDAQMWFRIALRYPIGYSSRVGAVYHKDAENRALVRNRTLKQHGFVNAIRNYLDTGAVPAAHRLDVFELIALSQIQVASLNVMEGNPRYARRLLRSCRGTKRYARSWWRMMLLTMLPPGWPARLKATRDAALDLAGLGR
ncbi:MAG: glycosyltransferase [candidate division WOR-3 bacterium]|nr:MAG: glycosyltransferase [candidate division WOR-3 bacterium]